MNVALIGGEGAGAQVLRLLRRLGHPLVALAAAEDPPDRPGLRQAAQAAGLSPLAATTGGLDALQRHCAHAAIDVGLNVHSLLRLPDALLRTARLGWLNLHPGLLPEFGGVMSASWALVEGAQEHGATLHWMDAGLDTGAIALQARFPIGPQDTGGSLSLRAQREGLVLVERLLGMAARGEPLPRVGQDPARLRRLVWQPPHRGRLPLDWPAAKLARLVRACDYLPLRSPWPAPRVRAGAQALGIAKAEVRAGHCDAPPGTVAHAGGDAVLLATVDGWLEVQRVLVPAGGLAPDRYAPASAWLQPGQRVTEDAP